MSETWSEKCERLSHQLSLDPLPQHLEEAFELILSLAHSLVVPAFSVVEEIKQWEQDALNAAREYEAADERMLSAQWSAIAFHYSRVIALLGVKEGQDA